MTSNSRTLLRATGVLTAAAVTATVGLVAVAPAQAIIATPTAVRAALLNGPQVYAAAAAVPGIDLVPVAPLTRTQFVGSAVFSDIVAATVTPTQVLASGSGVGAYFTPASRDSSYTSFAGFLGTPVAASTTSTEAVGRSVRSDNGRIEYGAVIKVGADALAFGGCDIDPASTVTETVAVQCALAVARAQGAYWRTHAPAQVYVSNSVIVPRLLVAAQAAAVVRLPARFAAATFTNGPVQTGRGGIGQAYAFRDYGTTLRLRNVAFSGPTYTEVDQYGSRTGAAYLLTQERAYQNAKKRPIAFLTANGFVYLEPVRALGRTTTKATAVVRISSALVFASCTASPYRQPPRSAVALCALRLASAQSYRVSPVLAAIK